jgi:hypothetical protein
MESSVRRYEIDVVVGAGDADAFSYAQPGTTCFHAAASRRAAGRAWVGRAGRAELS